MFRSLLAPASNFRLRVMKVAFYTTKIASGMLYVFRSIQ
jgi:hypothetical protein